MNITSGWFIVKLTLVETMYFLIIPFCSNGSFHVTVIDVSDVRRALKSRTALGAEI